MKNKEKIAILSIIVNTILAIGKIITGIFTNSIAILSDGIHSGMDIISSIISWFGIKKASKPADKEHPYGHYKIEVLTGLVITFILFITGIEIIYEAYKHILNPQTTKYGIIGLSVMLISTLANEGMARLKIYYGKKENSISLLSDGIHSRADVYASGIIFIGLIFDSYWPYIDPILAILVGLYIIKESFSLGKETIDSLLDTSAGEEIENKIKKIIKDENIQLDSLKTQKRGSSITANIVIKLPKDLTVEKASQISNKLKEKLLKNIENLSYIAIQIKDSDILSGYYDHKKNSFFKEYDIIPISRFNWTNRGNRAFKNISEYCVCPNCGYKTKHEKGIPCSSLICPRCHTNLVREDRAEQRVLKKLLKL